MTAVQVIKSNGRIRNFKMSVETYHDMVSSYSGLCLQCGSEKNGDTEPDAENYSCEDCEADEVFGPENLLVSGIILIKDEE